MVSETKDPICIAGGEQQHYEQTTTKQKGNGNGKQNEMNVQ